MYITLHDGVVVRLDKDADLKALLEARNQREVLLVLARLPVVPRQAEEASAFETRSNRVQPWRRTSDRFSQRRSHRVERRILENSR